MSNDNIIIETLNNATVTVKEGTLVSIKTEDEIRDEKNLVEMFNSDYINIVETLSGFVPKSIGNKSSPNHDKCTLQNIVQCYKNHSSIIKTKKSFKNLAQFDFTKPAVEDISLTINSLNPRKATGPYCIPLKFIKFSSYVIDSHLCNIIIKDLGKNISEEPKTALVRPIFLKNERNKIGNYRPVSIRMKDLFPIVFLIMMKQYYQTSYQLIENPMAQIMSY